MSERGATIRDNWLTALYILALVLLILTLSIGLPIYLRFFYYIQINTLNMPEQSGFSYETIKTAYDDVLNFLTLPGFEFKTGALAFSESGKAHFEDCKFLFTLNLVVMIVSAAAVSTLSVLNAKKTIVLASPLHHKAYFWAGVIALAIPLILGGLIAIDFEAAFTIFHTIFFLGKDNWLFDPATDQIILVMPEQFFMNCAIFIGVGLVSISGGLIAADLITAKKHKEREQ